MFLALVLVLELFLPGMPVCASAAEDEQIEEVLALEDGQIEDANSEEEQQEEDTNSGDEQLEEAGDPAEGQNEEAAASEYGQMEANAVLAGVQMQEADAPSEASITYYTVTYKDPFSSFPAQEYTVAAGNPVPAFEGTPTRAGYVFSTWNGQYKFGQINETVTSDRIFSARWTKVPSALDGATAVSKGQVRMTDEFRPNGGFDLYNVKLIADTFTVNDTVWDSENQKYTATVTITDTQPYISAMENSVSTYGSYTYVFNQEKTPEENLVIHFANKMSYKGTASSSSLAAYFGGWSLDSTYYPGSSRSQLIANRAYTVTYTDGVENEEIFADQRLTAVETAIDTAPVPAFGDDPVRSGYFFKGWTPEANDHINEDGTINGDVTYIAQWREDTGEYTVSFDSNGGDTIAPVTVKKGKQYGFYNDNTKLTSLPSAGFIDGLQNRGWYIVNEDGSYSEDSVSKTTYVTTARDHTLFQKREIKAPSVTVVSNRNPYNYTGENVILTATCTEYDGLVYSYQWSKDNTAIAGATGKTLELKGEVKDSGDYTVTVTVVKGESLANVVTINESVTATSSPKTITIRRTNNQLCYDPNGGTGGPSNNLDYLDNGTYVAKVQVDQPTRSGYRFTGWNTEKDGSGTAYKAGDLYEFGTPETNPNGGQRAYLYAQWRSNNYLDLNGKPDFNGQTEVWVDGVSYPVNTENGCYVDLPDSGDLLTIYTYNGENNLSHENYPTDMKVYHITRTETGATIERIEVFDDLLQYSGCSIRVTGKPGIRMITALTKDNKNALKGAGLAGYTLEEYGTVVQWADELGGESLTLGTGKHNYAYKKGVSDPVFANVGDLTQYTNVLVWDSLTDEQLGQDIVMRPYIILSKDGQTITLYGGTVSRSIGYIAYQNRAVFEPGTDAYKYVWDIIHAVYGNQYDSEYQG